MYQDYIYNRKDYILAGVLFNIIDGKLIAKKDNVKVIIPIEKFEKIIVNMCGSVKSDKMKFKIPKKLNSESTVVIELEDEDKNKTTSEEIFSPHYNGYNHINLLSYLEEAKNYVSIGLDSKGRIELVVSNELDINKRLKECFSTDSISLIEEIISYYLEETNNNIYIQDFEWLSTIINTSRFKKKRFVQLNQFFSYSDYLYLMNMESLGDILDRAGQQARNIIRCGMQLEKFGKSEFIESIIKNINDIKEEENRGMEKTFIFNNKKIVHPSFFEKGSNDTLLINELDSWDIQKDRREDIILNMRWFMLNSIKNHKVRILKHCLDLLEKNSLYLAQNDYVLIDKALKSANKEIILAILKIQDPIFIRTVTSDVVQVILSLNNSLTNYQEINPDKELVEEIKRVLG
jgi:hypothetical protein